MSKTYYLANDHEALIVLIRYAEHCGARCVFVRPINDRFLAALDAEVEITNKHDLRPFTADLDRRRSFWSEIAEINPSAVELIEADDTAEREASR